MTLQRITTEISRNIGSLEVIQYGRDGKSIIKAKDLLCGAYVLDDSIELRGISSMEISLERDIFLSYMKIGTNSYRFDNRKFNILIRPIEY